MFHLQRKYPNEIYRGAMLFDPTVYNHRTSITHAEVHSFILTLMLDWAPKIGYGFDAFMKKLAVLIAPKILGKALRTIDLFWRTWLLFWTMTN
jgi:hypothetical protein